MLQAMRSKAAGIVVKVLFSILVLSFAIWGIGDYSFLRRSDTTAVRVDDVKISATTLDQQYRNEMDRLRRTFGQIDPETARQFGLMDQVVQRLVNQTLLDKAAQRLGVRLGDDVLRSRLMNDPQLKGPDGRFDADRFRQILFQNNLSEAGFIAMLRQDLSRSLLTEAVGAGAQPPDILVDKLYRYRNEKRGGETVQVSTTAFTDVGKPDDEQLKATYEDNKDRFTAPEYRKLTVARIGADEVLPKITVTDQQIEDEYRARLSEFGTPEQRDVDQLLFTDEAAAKAAAEKLKAGTSFDQLATDNKQTPEQTHIGNITRNELVPELTNVIFSLPEGGTSDPVHSPFGWHIVRVTKIVAGKEPTLAEVKDKVVTDLKQRLAADAAYDYATKLEDAVANGASVEEAASKVGVPVTKIAAVDAQGRDPDGKPVPTFDGAQPALLAAFDTAEGGDTQLVEGKDGIWFMSHVDAITPSHLKPLADVRDDVVSMWQDKQRQEKAKARAEQIVAAVQAGKTLEAAAAQFGLKVSPAEPAVRTAGFNPRSTVPPEVNAKLFALKPGETGTVPVSNATYVVRLTQVIAADPAADKAGVDQLRAELRQQMSGDVVQAYVDALRQRYGVTINQDVIDRVTGS